MTADKLLLLESHRSRPKIPQILFHTPWNNPPARVWTSTVTQRRSTAVGAERGKLCESRRVGSSVRSWLRALWLEWAFSWPRTKAPPSSYAPVDIHETFAAIMARMSAAKPDIMKRQMALLEERYDLSNRPAPGVTMSRNKPVQQGVRVKLAAGVTRGTSSRNLLPTRSKPATSSPPASSPSLTPTTRKAECSSRSSKSMR